MEPHQPGVGRRRGKKGRERRKTRKRALRVDDKSLQFLSPFEEPLKKKFNFQVL